MFLLKTLAVVVRDPKQAVVMADWIEEFAYNKPESGAYVKKLRAWWKVRLTTLIDSVAKFGNDRERSLIRKVVSESLLRIRGRKRQRREMKKVPVSWNGVVLLSKLEAAINSK